jgi:hypothetical protein
MALESEVEACPFCGTDAIVTYDRCRDNLGKIKAQRREAVYCPNPQCPGHPTDLEETTDG